MLNLVKAYLDGIDNSQRKRDGFLFIGDLSKCRRQVVYALINAPKQDRKPMTQDKFDEGNERHEKVYGYWEKSGIEIIATEFNLNPYLKALGREMWHGRTDLIGVDEAIVVFADVKSTNSNAFKYSLPKENDILQLRGYAPSIFLLAQQISAQPPEGYLFYVDNNGTNTPRQFHFKFEQKDFDRLNLTMDTYENDWRTFQVSGELPPKEEIRIEILENKKQSWQCSYCDYQGVTCRIKEDLL